MTDTAPAPPEHPAFAINRDVAFLYEGFNQEKLLVQQCDACTLLRHPPSPFCPHCQCGDWTPFETCGEGRLHSYTVHYHPPIAPWPTPHAVGLADMAEGFRFVAAIPGAAPDALRIGQPVKVCYVAAGEERKLACFSIGAGE